MSTEPMSSDSEHLLELACDWLSKMYSGDFSPADELQLSVWRANSLAHEQAWQQAQAVWQGMEGLRNKTIPGSEPLLQERYPKPVTKPRYRQRLVPMAVACSVLLAVTLSVFYPPELWQADYVTDKGQQRTVTLTDGSKVTLNSASALAIHFDQSTRRVELLQGEAYFQVAKDKAHPFIVNSHHSEVRAVGTAFDVLRQNNQTKVELTEGIVEIHDARQLHRERLQAGQTALISDDAIALQATRKPENMALWRDGYLQFDNLPLHEAVQLINQYRTGRVVLLNNTLANKRVSGLFRLDALDQAVVSFKDAVPELQTIKMTSYLVVLR